MRSESEHVYKNVDDAVGEALMPCIAVGPGFMIFSTAIGLIIVATCIFYTILGEVNGKLPPQDQISMWLSMTR